MEDEELVVKGQSSYYTRDGAFVVAIGIALLALQSLGYVLGWTDDPFILPFGLFAAAAFLIGFTIIVLGRRAPCCRVCRVGLQPDRHIQVAQRAVAEVAAALARGDAQAIVRTVAAIPHRPPDKSTRLQIKYCPTCMDVGIVSLERQDVLVRGRPPSRVLSGSDLRRLLEISELDLG